MPDLDDLNFVRLVTPDAFRVIPAELFESIKEIDPATLERIYKYSVEIMTVPLLSSDGAVAGRLPNCSVWIAVLVDIAHAIKGFLWIELDVVEQRTFVQAAAIAKEYQSQNGAFIKKTVDYIKSLPVPEEMTRKIELATTRPRAFEKLGWVQSKRVLMELKNVEPQDTEPDDES